MKTLFITTALALFAAPALAETMTKWGCEWKRADNGNYWTKVDGGCKHWIGLGYATQADYLKSPNAAPADDESAGPGDDEGGEGPGTDPGDNGGGNEGAGPGDEGTGRDKPGRDRPGKGKGRR